MLSQYANSPVFVKLVNGIKDQLDNSKTLNDWYNIVFNLKTATGFGLDIWGKILNQSRRVSYDDNGTTVNVYLQGAQTVDGVSYTAEQMEDLYRTVLFFRAFSYITNCTVKSLNELLLFYFNDYTSDTESGKNKKIVYVYELGTMSIEVVFRFFINKLEKAIFTSDLFPKPTGVRLQFRYIPNGEWFGFYMSGKTATEQPFSPFDNRPFYPYLTEG